MKNLWKFLGIFGSISSIIGILLSFYFYNQAKENKEPFFYENPIKTKLIESKYLSDAPFKIVRLDSSEIKQDVCSTTFYFWNQGRKSIKRADILDSLIVSLPNSCEILKFKILGQSRDVCKISLKRIDKNNIKLDFDIIETLDGFLGQITFIGSSDQNLKLNGNIEGVKSFNSSTDNKNFLLIIGFSILFSLLLFVIMALTVSIFIRATEKDKVSLPRILKIIFFDKRTSLKYYIGMIFFSILFSIMISKSKLYSIDVNNVVPSEVREILN